MIGVISAADHTTVTGAIPSSRLGNYTGVRGSTPDVADISGELDPLLTTVAGLESLVSGIEASSTDIYNPAYGSSSSIGTIGSSSDPRIVTVNGDATFGPGTGVGILLVRGTLPTTGNCSWESLMLVIGQGELIWSGGGSGQVRGGIFIAKTGERHPCRDT